MRPEPAGTFCSFSAGPGTGAHTALGFGTKVPSAAAARHRRHQGGPMKGHQVGYYRLVDLAAFVAA